jgi:hypothetical protein
MLMLLRVPLVHVLLLLLEVAQVAVHWLGYLAAPAAAPCAVRQVLQLLLSHRLLLHVLHLLHHVVCLMCWAVQRLLHHHVLLHWAVEAGDDLRGTHTVLRAGGQG